MPVPPRCGDGNVDAGEECDDGNREDADECPSTCVAAFCGDGFVRGGFEECDDGNADDTDACPTTCESAFCGDGFLGPGESCDDGNFEDEDNCTSVCAPGPNLAFVTSQTFIPSALGGLAGADAACQAAAAAAGLPPNTYRAWLSDSSTNAIDPTRVGNGARGWVRTDRRAFADQLADLATVTGARWYPLRLNEFGAEQTGFVLTATDRNGMLDGGTCGDWTAADGSIIVGADPQFTGQFWTDVLAVGNACDFQPSHLYCFGVDNVAPVAPAIQAGRLAFQSTTAFAPGGGVAAADAVCQADAAANGLSGVFLALVATDSASAASRFTLAGPGWVRTDGLWVVENPADLPTGIIESSLALEADGVTFNGLGQRAWTGATTPGAVSAGESCNSWTSGALALDGRWGSTTATRSDYFSLSINSCFTGSSVYCLQQ